MNLKREIKKIIRETLTEEVEKKKRKQKPYKSNNPLGKKGKTPLQILGQEIDFQEKLIADYIKSIRNEEDPEMRRLSQLSLDAAQKKLLKMQNEYLELEGLSPMEEKKTKEVVDAPLTTRRLGLG
jgi:hypothetical protein